MEEQIHDIYDRIAKRCISLSAKCTVNLINGLFGTDYPPDSKVTYNWTENTDDKLKRTLSDTIITINEHFSYNVEFQMTADGDILLRVLEYGFHHALKSPEAPDTIVFPEPIVVYLYNHEKLPDHYTLNIRFGSQGSFPYHVPIFKYLEKPMEELEERKLIVLLPFQLLRLRKAINKKRTPENMAALQNLISHDILDSLKRNVAAGNITQVESMKLRQMILYLYQHIYSQYEELEEAGVNQMAEKALIFEVDILDDKIQRLEEANQSLENANQALGNKNQTLETTVQSLEGTIHSLALENQVWKLRANGISEEEIARQTGQPLDTIKKILQS